MTRFSLPVLVAKAVAGNKSWQPQWPDAEPKAEYDVVIVGAGGHGLGTAYYLAKDHGVSRVAVIDKGWLGGGNTGRNTTIIRSNYLYDESARLYEHAMKLWEGLSQELNYNVMFSQRGVMMLAHTVHDEQSFKRHIYSNRLNGIDNEWLTPQQAQTFCPPLNIAANARYPVVGAALQRRGGVARHDAVAWGYARGAAARGADIIQNCPVTAIRRDASGRVTGVDTPRGFIKAKKVAVAAAGNTSVVMSTADVRLPLESYPLQALVSEPVKPVFPCVVMSNTVHAYISQSDKGELVIGSGTDQYVSYSQRGGLPLIEHTLGGDLRGVPHLHPHAHAAQMGRHRRRHSRPFAHHRQDARGGPLRQLRLGHRRLQGHARIGKRVRPHGSTRRAAPDQRPLHD